ncbi:MAG: hypothetical protein EXS55_01795 [Candidatus Magasanikbacteria bacterium]|nr:hypothetical protein [Candidatus Magasanikbacteria bacterium]
MTEKPTPDFLAEIYKELSGDNAREVLKTKLEEKERPARYRRFLADETGSGRQDLLNDLESAKDNINILRAVLFPPDSEEYTSEYAQLRKLLALALKRKNLGLARALAQIAPPKEAWINDNNLIYLAKRVSTILTADGVAEFYIEELMDELSSDAAREQLRNELSPPPIAAPAHDSVDDGVTPPVTIPATPDVEVSKAEQDVKQETINKYRNFLGHNSAGEILDDFEKYSFKAPLLVKAWFLPYASVDEVEVANHMLDNLVEAAVDRKKFSLAHNLACVAPGDDAQTKKDRLVLLADYLIKKGVATSIDSPRLKKILDNFAGDAAEREELKQKLEEAITNAKSSLSSGAGSDEPGETSPAPGVPAERTAMSPEAVQTTTPPDTVLSTPDVETLMPDVAAIETDRLARSKAQADDVRKIVRNLKTVPNAAIEAEEAAQEKLYKQFAIDEASNRHAEEEDLREAKRLRRAFEMIQHNAREQIFGPHITINSSKATIIGRFNVENNLYLPEHSPTFNLYISGLPRCVLEQRSSSNFSITYNKANALTVTNESGEFKYETLINGVADSSIIKIRNIADVGDQIDAVVGNFVLQVRETTKLDTAPGLAAHLAGEVLVSADGAKTLDMHIRGLSEPTLTTGPQGEVSLAYGSDYTLTIIPSVAGEKNSITAKLGPAKQKLTFTHKSSVGTGEEFNNLLFNAISEFVKNVTAEYQRLTEETRNTKIKDNFISLLQETPVPAGSARTEREIEEDEARQFKIVGRTIGYLAHINPVLAQKIIDDVFKPDTKTTDRPYPDYLLNRAKEVLDGVLGIFSKKAPTLATLKRTEAGTGTKNLTPEQIEDKRNKVKVFRHLIKNNPDEAIDLLKDKKDPRGKVINRGYVNIDIVAEALFGDTSLNLEENKKKATDIIDRAFTTMRGSAADTLANSAPTAEIKTFLNYYIKTKQEELARIAIEEERSKEATRLLIEKNKAQDIASIKADKEVFGESFGLGEKIRLGKFNNKFDVYFPFREVMVDLHIPGLPRCNLRHLSPGFLFSYNSDNQFQIIREGTAKLGDRFSFKLERKVGGKDLPPVTIESKDLNQQKLITTLLDFLHDVRTAAKTPEWPAATGFAVAGEVLFSPDHKNSIDLYVRGRREAEVEITPNSVLIISYGGNTYTSTAGAADDDVLKQVEEFVKTEREAAVAEMARPLQVNIKNVLITIPFNGPEDKRKLWEEDDARRQWVDLRNALRLLNCISPTLADSVVAETVVEVAPGLKTDAENFLAEIRKPKLPASPPPPAPHPSNRPDRRGPPKPGSRPIRSDNRRDQNPPPTFTEPEIGPDGQIVDQSLPPPTSAPVKKTFRRERTYEDNDDNGGKPVKIRKRGR